MSLVTGSHRASWLSIALVLTLGCGGSLLQIQPIPVTANPTEQVEALGSELEDARQARLDILAPTWFDRAEKSYRTALRLRDQGGAVGEILAEVAEGRAELVEARKFARISETTLPTVIQARDDARAAGGPSLGEPYDDVEEDFLELTRGIENDDLGWAQRTAPKVERAFREVELRAITETTGQQIEALIEQAIEEGARKLTPRTLKEAERTYAALNAFITKNRYASAEIGERAAEALFQAKRALYVNREALRVQKASAGPLALTEEAFLRDVSAALGAADFRDNSFETQRSSIETAARELKKDRDYLVAQAETLRGTVSELQTEIARLEGQTATEREQIARLEDEKRFNALYEQVRASFAPEEAEVYKRGQQLVIRLRGVNFPVGSSVLLPENYALLSKVQKSVREFGSPRVLIEGHTDATGSAQVNQHLSEKRAYSVAEYLVANNTLPREAVTAVGRGFSVPLADNKTAQGRATNRRIDVIIEASRAAGDVAATTE